MTEDPAPYILPDPEDAVTETADAPPPLVLLDDVYVGALLGHTVSVSELPRAVYSLTKLVRAEREAEKMPEDAAQMSIANKVAHWSEEHGPSCPMFVDDAVSCPKEKSRIVRPGGFGRSRLR